MKTKLVLEAGCNHQGNMKTAHVMIEEAKRLGAFGIKFQKRDLNSIPEEIRDKKRNLSNSFGETYFKHRDALEFNIYEMEELKYYCEGLGINFICSAFDYNSILELIGIKCRFIKIPSQLYSDEVLYNKIMKLKKDNDFEIWVSTGMHNSEEIFSNKWIKDADVLFHCVSVYPACLTRMNLKTIQELSKIRNKVGYSSHENEGLGIKLSIFAGAEYVERHFTIDKEWKGSDHSTVSSDIPETERIVSEIKYAEEIIGTSERLCSLKERIVRKIYRGKGLEEK